MLLEIKNCGVQFGGLKALSQLSLDVASQELLGIIGPNGAGKTTFFNLVTGVNQPTEGEIFFEDQPLRGLKPYQINRCGMARTFQNIRLFSELSVEDNVLIAFHTHIRSSLLAGIIKKGSFRAEEKELRQKAGDLLDVFGLKGVSGEYTKNLCYGDQRRLEIVRALATRPKLLLLDEPAAGMNATEKNSLVELIRKIQKDYQLAVILIEHDMSVVMNLCPRIVVLDHGEKIAEGTPEAIRKDPRVIEAYLGTAKRGAA